MITNYLIELLKDNECVIVPDFGAFISKRHPATIDYANHRFMPPYKEIVFNDKLTSNDNVLADFISKKEGISTDESLKKIQDFVNQSMAILEVNSKLKLEGIGKIQVFGNNYVFTSDENVNILGDSFGLTDFNMHPVFRSETYQIIKEQIVIEQKEKNTEYTLEIESVEEQTTSRKPSLFRTFALTTMAFLLIFIINWTTDKDDSNLASWNPFLYSSPNEFLLNNMDADDIENVMVVEDIEVAEDVKVVEDDIENVMVVEDSIEDVKVEVVIEEFDIQDEVFEIHYYIVGGSFQTISSAEKCLSDIKKQGFERASLLDKNDKGYIRVYYESFAEKAEALSSLEKIKKEFNESAWLLFQK